MLLQRLWLSGAVLLLLASPVSAQFSQLAATDDGSQLYFTSEMMLHGKVSPLPSPESMLYRFGPDGVTLFAERGALADPNDASTGDGVSTPSVSGDGSLVAFTFNGICLSLPDCTVDVNEAELRGSSTMDLGQGDVQLSRNGRWALIANQSPDPSAVGTCTLVDLTTGQRTVIPSSASWLLETGVSQVASDGTVLVTVAVAGTDPLAGGTDPLPGGMAQALWKQGKFTSLPFPIRPIAISDDASTLIGYAAPLVGPPSQLVTLSLGLGRITTVVQTNDSTQTPVFMAASNNGQRLLYRIESEYTANGPAYIWDAATGKTTPVPLASGELANDGTISGLGNYAFVATNQAQIVKFDIAAGTVSRLFPAPPVCDDPGYVGAGELVQMRCFFTTPLADLQGQILYNGNPVPVLSSSAGQVDIQIPWNWDDFMTPTLSFNVPSDSPFDGSQQINVFDGAPMMLPADPGDSSLFGIKIVKGDWSGPVTIPPAPGDIVYIYMTGLGWPQQMETTGVPASLTVPNPIAWALSCQFLPQAEPAELLFAGMAPGLIGVYQTTFRMPADAGAPLTDIQCTLTSPAMSATFGPGTPAPGLFGEGTVITIPLSSNRRRAGTRIQRTAPVE
jgi:uncharacterized protein (TIGR03437 family)